MFNRINISTSMILVLMLFGLLQLVSNTTAYLFLRANDASIDEMRVIATEQDALSSARNDLLQAQYYINNVTLQLSASMATPSERTMEKALQAASDSSKDFAAFMDIPGLTKTWPELSGSLSKAFNAQLSTVQQQIALLQSKTNSEEMLNGIHRMTDEKNRTRRDFDNIYKNYYKLANDKYDQKFHHAQKSFSVFIELFIGVIIVTVALLLLVHYGMRHILIYPLSNMIEHFNLIERGDLRNYPETRSKNEIGRLYAGLEKMQRGLAATILSVRQGAESISLGSQEISAGNTDLSSRTEEQAAALTQTAASMEQISSTVQQNADNARQAMGMVHSATDIAKQGEALMNEMVGKMNTINTNAQQVSDIIQVIDSIAFQTNILALNAAVEAARAGEQGRGFAVVAGEVRSLAQRCATSAKEIGGLLALASTEIGDGVGLANNAGDNMNLLAASVNSFASIMEDITIASNEQSSGVEQIRIALSQMDQVTQQNAALVEEVAATASGVASQAVLLESAVAVFQVGDQIAEKASEARSVMRPPVRTAPVARAKTQEEWESF